jgi:hypothetical protein
MRINMFGRILYSTDALNHFRTTYESLSDGWISDEYLSKGTIRGFFDNKGRLVGGYIVNTTPEFRYISVIPEHDREELPINVDADRIAEVACIWMTPNQRPPLLRYKIYTQAALDAFKTDSTYILGGTYVEKVRRIQQRVMKHDLWHGINIYSREHWIYYAKRRELLSSFLWEFICELSKLGLNRLAASSPRWPGGRTDGRRNHRPSKSH